MTDDNGRLLRSAALAEGEGEAEASDAATRLLARASAEGLLDVAYAGVDSPFGRLLVAATPRGLVRIDYLLDGSETEALERLAARISPRLLEAPGEVDHVRRELDEYFAGQRRDFDLALDWRLTAGFSRRVLRATARVGYGHTSTYAELARRAGSSRAHRAAGNALHHNPLPIVVPCHRVLRTGGGLGGYAGGLPVKERLLRLEGAL